MDGVEASRIIEATLVEISKQHNLDLSKLREEHLPIKVALQNEANGKAYAAYDRGCMDIEMRHLFISQLGFGRVARGEDVIDKAGIYRIIDSVIRVGTKSPGTLNINKLNLVQSELASCKSIDGVVAILDANRKLICDSFGVDDSNFEQCIEELNELDTVTA